ncbi:MAG: AhpC/TSA family protein [Prevotellaceae bacterium]|jgi:thiol-disulfide isomerase/thioredoxin|nr:AhpC/TSA family protein [Prevotellaceae bacterium]
MKRLRLFWIILPLLITACGKTPNQVTVAGEIKGVGTDTLLLYSTDDLGTFIRKVPVDNDKFSYSFPVDTLIQTTLVYDNGRKEYPIFIDKHARITISGNASDSTLHVAGTPVNEALTAFFATLQPDSVIAQAENYIRSNPASPASLYVLNRFFIDRDTIDYDQALSLIGVMDGALQDRLSVATLKTELEQMEKGTGVNVVPAFTLNDEQGNTFTRSELTNKANLIYVWASWDDSCRTMNKEINELYQTLSKKKRTRSSSNTTDNVVFNLISVSLDLDKQAWLEAIRTDSLQGKQGCAFLGWQTPLIQSLGIDDLPYTLVVNGNNVIRGRNLSIDETKQIIETLINEENNRKRSLVRVRRN